MLRFHNAVIQRLRGDPAYADWSAGRLFRKAQQEVRWHYQWIILHDYLPKVIKQERLTQLLQAPAPRGKVRMPIEFSVGAFRYGHSQVRPSYRINFGPDGGARLSALYSSRFWLPTPYCVWMVGRHWAAAREMGIVHRPVNLAQGIRVVAGVYHVQNVNAYDNRFKKEWMRRLHGVATRHLPNYLGWRRFIETRT